MQTGRVAVVYVINVLSVAELRRSVSVLYLDVVTCCTVACQQSRLSSAGVGVCICSSSSCSACVSEECNNRQL